MKFNDDFEFEASTGEVFYLSVVGEKFIEDGQIYTEIMSVEAADESGDLVEQDHPLMSEINEEAQYRDYDIEIHSSDFDYYENAYSGLGKDKFDL
jgi:hypothetical protein